MKVDPTKTELENFIALYNASDYATQYAIGTNPNLGTPTAITDPDYNTQIDITKDDGGTLTVKYNRLDLQDQINQVFFNGKSCFISDSVKSIEDVIVEAETDFNDNGYNDYPADKLLSDRNKDTGIYTYRVPDNHIYAGAVISHDLLNNKINDKLKFINNSVTTEISMLSHDLGTTDDFDYADDTDYWLWGDNGINITYAKNLSVFDGGIFEDGYSSDNYDYKETALHNKLFYSESVANTSGYNNVTDPKWCDNINNEPATPDEISKGVLTQYFNNNGEWEYKVTAKENSLIYINTGIVSIHAINNAVSVNYGLTWGDYLDNTAVYTKNLGNKI